MSEHTYLSIHVCMFVLDDTFLFSFQVGIYYVEIFVQNKVYFFSYFGLFPPRCGVRVLCGENWYHVMDSRPRGWHGGR